MKMRAFEIDTPQGPQIATVGGKPIVGPEERMKAAAMPGWRVVALPPAMSLKVPVPVEDFMASAGMSWDDSSGVWRGGDRRQFADLQQVPQEA